MDSREKTMPRMGAARDVLRLLSSMRGLDRVTPHRKGSARYHDYAAQCALVTFWRKPSIFAVEKAAPKLYV